MTGEVAVHDDERHLPVRQRRARRAAGLGTDQAVIRVEKDPQELPELATRQRTLFSP